MRVGKDGPTPVSQYQYKYIQYGQYGHIHLALYLQQNIK